MTLHLPPEPESLYAVTGDIKDINTFSRLALRADRLAVARAVVEQCAAMCDEITAARDELHLSSTASHQCASTLRALLKQSTTEALQGDSTPGLRLDISHGPCLAPASVIEDHGHRQQTDPAYRNEIGRQVEAKLRAYIEKEPRNGD